ncbi:MAG: family transposase [Rubritepida sp.]|nr:family transposase [Rubritepida sp.]
MPSPLRIPHAPLSDTDWNALLPHLPASLRGRPCDLRARFDAIFRLAATDGPWRDLPEQYGKPDTISRHFRRMTHEGLWERLLKALAAAPENHPLRNLLGPICRAARRAIRLRGLALILLARRLDLKRTLPGPPWMVADPDLSEILFAQIKPDNIPTTRSEFRPALVFFGLLRRTLAVTRGRRYIPRCLKAYWI